MDKDLYDKIKGDLPEQLRQDIDKFGLEGTYTYF